MFRWINNENSHNWIRVRTLTAHWPVTSSSALNLALILHYWPSACSRDESIELLYNEAVWVSNQCHVHRAHLPKAFWAKRQINIMWTTVTNRAPVFHHHVIYSKESMRKWTTTFYDVFYFSSNVLFVIFSVNHVIYISEKSQGKDPLIKSTIIISL